MTLRTERTDDPVSVFPEPGTESTATVPRSGSIDEQTNRQSPSRSGSEGSEGDKTPQVLQRVSRPQFHTRKSSGTIIVPSTADTIEMFHEEYDEGDARTMSPRRSSEEVDRLEEGLRRSMMEQAKQLQASLLSLVDRVESVKAEHEKLEGGNRFLQSYIGELMQTSKITATGAAKSRNKGKARSTK